MLTGTHTLAAGDGKDLLETVFFVAIALITVLGPIFNKIFKKTDGDESSEISIDDSVFGEIESEESDETPAPEVIDYNATSAYDRLLRERRDAQLFRTQARHENPARSDGDEFSLFGEISRSAHADATPLPRNKHVFENTPHVPAATPAPAPTTNPAPLAPDDLLSDREALRRAVLAQEILSPPLSLRER